MVSVAEGLAVVDRIVGFSSAVDYWQPIMRDEFTAAAGKTSGELTAMELMDGLTRAVHSSLWGLRVDRADTIAGDAVEFIDTRVGRPDNTAGYTDFAWTGTVINEGLVALDTWLQTDHERHRQQLVDDGSPDPQLNNLRLIEIVTGSDYALSIAHPVAEHANLIEHLKQLGIQARSQTLAPWPGTKKNRYNICEFIEQHLITNYNFEPDEHDGFLIHHADDQHAVLVWNQMFERGRNKGASAFLRFLLARRDIVETVRETTRPNSIGLIEIPGNEFANRPPANWFNLTDSPEEIADYLDHWIPQILPLANFTYIENYLTFDDPTWDDNKRHICARRRWPARVANRLLWGWQPEDNQLIHDHKNVTELEAIHNWINQHPNGKPRTHT